MSESEVEDFNKDDLHSYLNNNYVESDTEQSVDGYSEAESVDVANKPNYQIFSTLLEDNDGNNVSSNISSLNKTYKTELEKINNNLEQLNKTIGATYGLIREYLKIQLNITSKQNPKSSKKKISKKPKNNRNYNNRDSKNI
tara:strand:- start:256 stop:678 length:423 start_codon:yes stop_codon:yes gene_type:complete